MWAPQTYCPNRITKRLDAIYSKDSKYLGKMITLSVKDCAMVRRCHVELLTRASPVIEAMLRWDPSTEELQLGIGSPKAFDLIMDYICGDDITIEGDQIPEILELADFLDMPDIIQSCDDIIPTVQTTSKNCFQLVQLCTLYDIDQSHLTKYVRANLVELVREDDMLSIDRVSLENLLRDETLSYMSTINWMWFIIRWCNLNETRQAMFPDLFQELDLRKIDKAQITQSLTSEPLMKMHPVCLEECYTRLAVVDTDIPMVLILFPDRDILLNTLNSASYSINIPDYGLGNEYSSCDKLNVLRGVSHSSKVLRVSLLNTSVLEKKDVVSSNGVESTRPLWTHYLNTDEFDILVYLRSSVSRKYPSVSTLCRVVKETKTTVCIEPFIDILFHFTIVVVIDSTLYICQNMKRIKTLYRISLKDSFMRSRDLTSSLNTFGEDILSVVSGEQQLLVCTSHRIIRLNCITLDIERIDDIGGSTEESGLDIVSPRFVYQTNSIYRINNSRRKWKYEQITDDGKILPSVDIEIPVIDDICWFQIKNIFPVQIPRTYDLCHVMCPHCDPDIEDKIEQMKMKMEAEESMYGKWRPNMDYGDDDDNFYEEFYEEDNYSDNNGNERYWDASADEWVDAWW